MGYARRWLAVCAVGAGLVYLTTCQIPSRNTLGGEPPYEEVTLAQYLDRQHRSDRLRITATNLGVDDECNRLDNRLRFRMRAEDGRELNIDRYGHLCGAFTDMKNQYNAHRGEQIVVQGRIAAEGFKELRIIHENGWIEP